jgi:hypothetical protein
LFRERDKEKKRKKKGGIGKARIFYGDVEWRTSVVGGDRDGDWDDDKDRIAVIEGFREQW